MLYIILAFVTAIFTITHCASSNQSRRSLYPFDFEGHKYEIICTTFSDGDGYNMLLLKRGDDIVLSAKDIDQDGKLDMTITGEISLQQANNIYRHGIRKARSEYKYEGKFESTVFQTSDDKHEYYIESCFNFGFIGNKFTIFDRQNRLEIVAVDNDGDGSLDSLQKGNNNLRTYEHMYGAVLKTGIDAGAIIKRTGVYQVANE